MKQFDPIIAELRFELAIAEPSEKIETIREVSERLIRMLIFNRLATAVEVAFDGADDGQ